MKQIRVISEEEVREAMKEKHRIIPDVVVYICHALENNEWDYWRYCQVAGVSYFGNGSVPDNHILNSIWLYLAKAHPRNNECLQGQYWLVDLLRSHESERDFIVHPKMLMPMSIDEFLQRSWQEFLK